MSDCKTYGYRHLDEKSYSNIMSSPNFGAKIPSIGYNLQATKCVCQNFAKQTPDCGFLDTSVMLNSKTQNEALLYVLQESNHKNIISGEIMINPEQNQFVLLDDVSVILSAVMGDKNDVLQKFVAPLTIYSSDKESHGVALCIEADRKNNAINIMILEQHAKRDKGNLDFSKEVNATLEHLKNRFSETGMQITTFQNDKPICREKGVCSVVSLEVCRRLLQSDEPLHIAKAGMIKINAEQVQKLHQENFQNWQKNRQNTGDSKMDDMEEIFQHYLNSYATKKKMIPIEIIKKKVALAKDEQDYQKAVAENDERMIRGYQDIIKEDKYELEVFEEKSSFLREPTKEDFEYRWRQRNGFPQKVARYANRKEMLCFHGTDIFGAKHILESGQISSGVDRLGRATSFDPRGKISVTNKDTVDTSVGTYMNLTANFLYPAGCLFVIKPKDKDEYDQLSSTGWMIDNVDFNANPERLVAIVTTPENIERVSEWAQKSNIDTAKVMNFEDFIAKCKGRDPRDPRRKDQMPDKYSEIKAQ